MGDRFPSRDSTLAAGALCCRIAGVYVVGARRGLRWAMSSSWLSSGSGGWGFGRRVVDPEQARREAEAIATAPPEWPTFTGPKVFEGSSDLEVVPSLSEFSIEIHLQPTQEPLSVFYEFSTQAEEGFGLTGAGVKGNMAFRIDLVNVAREELMELLGTRVYQSHLQVVRGENKLPRLKSPCKLQLVFDNTHSMMKEKKLAYKVVVIHHSHIAGRDFEPYSPGGSGSGPKRPAAATGALAPAPAPEPTRATASVAAAASQGLADPATAIDAETIRAFYQEHAPEKPEADVQAVIDKYAGQEAKLMRKLQKKYIEKPAAATATATTATPAGDSAASSPGSNALDVSSPQHQLAAQAPGDEMAPEFEEAEGEWM
jgi:hypothetical protein